MKKVLLGTATAALALCATFISPAQQAAAPGDNAPVPRTGQTTIYLPGDDGALQKGVHWPIPRFTDKGDGTIRDNLTKLNWLRNANCAGTSVTWATALAYVAELNSSGTMNGQNCGDTSNGKGVHQTNWRLPNCNELASLLDLGTFNPALPTDHQFTNFQASRYWSSTTDAGNSPSAWNVDFHAGNVGASSKGNFGFDIAVNSAF
jgi:hypothetical protein